MSKTYDHIVIGAGVVGSSIALSLARAGGQIIVVDALPAAGYGSTSYSSAIVRPFYSHEVSCAIAHAARSRWLTWRDFLEAPADEPLAEYRETGGLVLVNEGTEDSYANNLAALDAVGVAYEWLDADGLRARYPGINLAGFGPPRRLDEAGFGEPTTGRISSGIYIPACGHVSDPQLAARNLADAAQRAGAEFRFNASVATIDKIDGRVCGVTLADGSAVRGATVINAAGPHSAAINQLAEVELPIKTAAQRHEVAYVAAPAGSDPDRGFVVDFDSGVYHRGDGGDWLIGSADPECDDDGIVDPDDYDNHLTDQWTTQVYRAAQRFPELGIESQARGTVGLYDVSDDWIPVYDRTDLEGYLVAIGTSGNQFKNAPLIGDIMAAVAHADDHDKRPATLRLPEVDKTVSLDFYSRHRVVQATSNVMA